MLQALHLRVGGGGSVLGYSQANSSQPNTVHEYIHISEVRLYAELSMIAENIRKEEEKSSICWHLYNFSFFCIFWEFSLYFEQMFYDKLIDIRYISTLYFHIDCAAHIWEL